jgi:hypothetical protein
MIKYGALDGDRQQLSSPSKLRKPVPGFMYSPKKDIDIREEAGTDMDILTSSIPDRALRRKRSREFVGIFDSENTMDSD